MSGDPPYPTDSTEPESSLARVASNKESPLLILSPPLQLAEDCSQPVSEAARAAVVPILELGPAATPQETLDALDVALQRIPDDGTAVPLEQLGRRDDYVEYDDYFGVVRVGGSAVDALLRAAIKAHSHIIRDGFSGNSLSQIEWFHLHVAFLVAVELLIETRP